MNKLKKLGITLGTALLIACGDSGSVNGPNDQSSGSGSNPSSNSNSYNWAEIEEICTIHSERGTNLQDVIDKRYNGCIALFETGLCSDADVKAALKKQRALKICYDKYEIGTDEIINCSNTAQDIYIKELDNCVM